MGAAAIVVGDALVDEVDGAAHVGGAALNVAVGLARLGMPASLVAMVGDDAPGRAVRAHVERHGVELLATPAPHGTAVATAVRDGGTMRYDFNRAGLERLVDLGGLEERMRQAPLVVASCFAAGHDAQIAPLLEHAAGRLVVDPNARPAYLAAPGASDRFAAGLERLAAVSALVKLSDEDAALLWGAAPAAAAERLLGLGARAVVVTEGAAGATAWTAAGPIHAPIAQLPGEIVDTIGAGDSVLASLTASLLADGDRLDWARALDRAMAIAAATVRGAGGLLRVP